MNSLTKKLFRDLLAGKAQVIAVIVVTGLGVTLFTGVFFSARSMGDSVNVFYEEMNYDDFIISVESAPPEIAGEARKIENVSGAQGRLVEETVGRVGKSSLTIKVITLPDTGRPAVNNVELLEGGYLEPDAKGTCLAEYHLASEFNLKPGDSVDLAGADGRSEFRITGVAASPEYVRMTGKSELFADPRQLGVVFITSSEAERLFDRPLYYNELMFKVDSLKSIDVAMDEAEALLEPFNVIGVTKGEDWGSAAWTQLDIQNQRTLATFFGPLFLIVAALTLFVAITRQVMLQQRQIGISRAMGYGRKSILLHYMGYGAVPGLIGSVLGIAGGLLMGGFVVRSMQEALAIPPIFNSRVYWDIALLGV
ncbi:MAG: ABC transporter permease, partial [Actinobacteria bacterium]|nr:ABC transporter permease [Actinomycetota bacterium]